MMKCLFKNNNSGVTLLELIVATAVFSVLIIFVHKVIQMQSVMTARNDMEAEILELRNTLLDKIDCRATLDNFAGTCDGIQTLRLYTSSNGVATPLTSALESSGGLNGSGEFQKFYLKATCLEDHILVDAAIAKLQSGRVYFKTDPLSYIKEGVAYRQMDFRHPLTRGLIGQHDAFCTREEEVVNTGDGYQRLNANMYVLEDEPSTSGSWGNTGRIKISSVAYTTKGERLSVNLERTVLGNAHVALVNPYEAQRFENAQADVYLYVGNGSKTYINEKVAHMDFSKASFYHLVQAERIFDVDPETDVEIRIDLDVKGFTSDTYRHCNALCPGLAESEVGVNEKGKVWLRGSGFTMIVEDYQK